MMISPQLIQTLVLKYPLNHCQNNVTFLSNYRALWRMKQMPKLQEQRRRRNTVSKIIVKGEDVGFVDAGDGFVKVAEFEQNELLKSEINPLQIGFKVADFDVGCLEHDFDFGNGEGGKGDGGNGSGGNGDQGDAGGSEANDELTGLKWWWLWQWNRANRPRKPCRTTINYTYNDHNELIELAIQMLATQVMPPTDMAKASLNTMHAIQDLMSFLHQVLMFPIVFPLVLYEFENNRVFERTMFGILVASVLLAAVFSGAVVYGLWRWYHSLGDHDTNEDDSD
ncbi:hypothetical protein RND81_06G115300 [Saponaria officinalis]|uniref:Uncharacterized protein n=1 Tax=Saponaria officinalis TaxID=3572 RepID=A0AAW1K5H4_SAPOF